LPAWQYQKTHCISLNSFWSIFWMLKIGKKRIIVKLNMLNSYIPGTIRNNLDVYADIAFR